MPSTVARAELLAGAKAVAPMLVGVIPFGLVAGATPATTGLGGGTSIGLSTIVFAGASQLAAADALADGGSALVAVIAACTINLRLLLYSASLAPHLARVPLRQRLLIGYFLTDQAYAVSITRWTEEADAEAAGGPPAPGLYHKLPFYFGAAVFFLAVLWTVLRAREYAPEEMASFLENQAREGAAVERRTRRPRCRPARRRARRGGRPRPRPLRARQGRRRWRRRPRGER